MNKPPANQPKKPKSAADKAVVSIDVPTLMVILTALILLPLLVTGFVSQ